MSSVSLFMPLFRRIARTSILTLALWLLSWPNSTLASGLTPEDVSKTQSVRSVEISPNGQHIAYLLTVPRTPYEDEDGAAWSELHIVDKKGASRPFVTGQVNVGAIQWTPDGRAISFLAKRGKDKHKSLYVIAIDGGEARNVLSFETNILSYSWSPSGKQVAFLAKEKISKKKKKYGKKGFKAEIFEEELRDTHVWIATPDNDEDEPKKLDIEGSASELHWSPVADQLAVALAPTPLIDDHYMRRKVHIVDANSGKSLAHFDNPGKLGSVRWSPDGKRLAIISAEDINDPSAGRLMVASPEDGSLRNLLEDYLGEVSAIAWQDNDTIMFLGDEGVWTTFGEISHEGANRKTLIAKGKVVLAGLSLSKNGQFAAFRIQSPAHPNEVALMSHGNNKPRKLTDSNPWLKDVSLARQEVIAFKARDGLEIEGLLIRPLEKKSGQRVPLILTVHGGPESHYQNGWITRYAGPGQVAASRGFAVFYPNYRGSTGRGVEFSKLGQADYAGKEFDDLVDAVDHLIDMGLADKDRVGITGGSYGGFAAAWGATYYSERFAASVMFVGVSNHISKGGTTDIPNEMFLVHARKKLHDSWDFFLKRSPLYYVKKARTPILILHGKNDTRVPPSQSMELYRNLKNLGQTPARLVHYPGEGHGNRRAAAQLDYNLRMLRWFEHYLTGPGGNPPNYEIDYGFDDEEDEKEDS